MNVIITRPTDKQKVLSTFVACGLYSRPCASLVCVAVGRRKNSGLVFPGEKYPAELPPGEWAFILRDLPVGDYHLVVFDPKVLAPGQAAATVKFDARGKPRAPFTITTPAQGTPANPTEVTRTVIAEGTKLPNETITSGRMTCKNSHSFNHTPPIVNDDDFWTLTVTIPGIEPVSGANSHNNFSFTACAGLNCQTNQHIKVTE